MSHNYSRLFYHFVWSTWERTPMLTGEVEAKAYAVIRAQSAAMNIKVLAIGGIADHVHVLVSMPAVRDLPLFIKSVKGVSSRTLNQIYGSHAWNFKWQGRYGAITVSPSHMGKLTRYILNQKQHHADGTLWPSCEQIEDD